MADTVEKQIKTKLSFDGEADYKKAVADINSNLKTLNSEMKLVTAEYKANGASVETLKAKQETLQKVYAEQKAKVEETEKALAKCRQETGENSAESKKLEQALNYQKAALVGTEGELKKTADELDNLEHEADEAGDEIEDTEKKSSKLGETMGSVVTAGLKAAAAAAAAAVSAIAAMGAASIKVGAEFETSMAKTGTLFTGTDEEFKQLNDDILRISSSTGLAASGLAEAAYSAESAGVAQEDLANMLEQSAHLAAAGFTDVETALSATAKTMNAYGENAGTVEEIQKVLIQTQNLGITTVDELGASLAQVTPTAAAFGVSFDQVGASLAVMTAAGTPTAQATTQLNALIAELAKNGTTASKNLMAAAEGTEYAGMSFNEMMNAGADLSDVLALMQAQADKSGVSMVDMFSSMEAGKAALSIFGEDGSTFKDDLAQMTTDMDVVTQGYNAMMDTFENKSNVLKTTAQNLGISIYQGMQEPLKEWADVGIESVQALQQAFSEGGFSGMVNELGEILGNIVAKVTEQAPLLVDSAVELLDSFINAIVAQLPTITQAATKIILTLVNGLLKMLPTIINGAAQIILSLATGIAQALPELIPTIVDVVMQIVNMLVENVPLLIDAALQLMQGLVEGIIQAIPVIIAALPQLIESIINSLITAIPQLIQGAIQLFMALVEAIPVIIDALVAALPQIIEAVVGGLIQGIPLIIEGSIQLFMAILEAMPQILAALAEALPQIVMAIVNGLGAALAPVAEWGANLLASISTTFSNVIQNVIQWGSNMLSNAITAMSSFVNGIINTIKDIPTKIYNTIIGAVTQVTNWGSIVLEAAKSAMQKVKDGIINVFSNIGESFKNIGTNIVNGIWSGISDGWDWLKEKVGNLASSLLDAAKDALGIKSPSRKFRDEVGVYMAQGIGVGFEQEMKSVSQQIENAIPTDFDIAPNVEVGANVSGRSGAGMFGAGVTVIQNIYANTTDYAKQQREAAKNFRLIARTV